MSNELTLHALYVHHQPALKNTYTYRHQIKVITSQDSFVP